MRFTLLAYGSRGDVQPYVALGVGLRRAGHEVRLAAPALYRDFVTGYGLEFAPLTGDPTQLMQTVVAGSPGNPNVFQAGRLILEHVIPIGAQVMAEAEQACAGADGILTSLLTATLGHELALRLKIPDLAALVFPVYAQTSAFPNPGFPPLPLGAGYNRLTHRLFNFLAWQGSRLGYALVRRGHPDFPALSGWPFDARAARPTPILYGLSRLALPPGEWSAHTELTGFWFLDAPADWQPPAALVDFLAAGPPPVFIGFGSIITREAQRLAASAVAALTQTGQRGVLLTGWGGLAEVTLPPTVLQLESAPFDWLFPRVAAAVHHGGVGTTAAALRAGVPAVVVPFTADQPFWGRQVHRLGVGPQPIPARRLTAERLAAAIRTVLEDQAMQQRAAALGAQLRAEDGVGNAVRAILRYWQAY